MELHFLPDGRALVDFLITLFLKNKYQLQVFVGYVILFYFFTAQLVLKYICNEP